MTLYGFIFKKYDQFCGTNKHLGYQNFREAYYDSTQITRANQLQSWSWVIALLAYHGLTTTGFAQNFILGFSYPFAAISIIGIMGVLANIAIIPGYFYRKNKPFKFSVRWFPIREKPHVIKRSEQGKLRVDRAGEGIIAAIIEPRNHVDELDIQLVSENDDVSFTVNNPRGTSLDVYRDHNGFITNISGSGKPVTPILKINVEDSIGSAPNPMLHLLDVSSVEKDRKDELTDQEALDLGNDILSIEVEE